MGINVYLNNFFEFFCWNMQNQLQFGKKFLTVCCYEFCIRQWQRQGAEDQQIKTNKFSLSCQVQIETGFRCSSKKIQRIC